MRRETISIHQGFTCDPSTKAVAPPIYRNVAYEFDSADHGGALFNLELPGYGAVWSLCRRWTRICSLLLKERQRPS